MADLCNKFDITNPRVLKMGRKRQTRKRTDRVNSKTSLNSGNVSSDSESETSLVSRKERRTVCGQTTQTNGSADTDCNAPTHSTGASSNHTTFGQHCFTSQTVHDERAPMSFDRSVSQENIPSENMQPAQPDHGQQLISVPSDDYATDQTAQRLPVSTGLGRFVSQLNSRRESTLCNAQPDTLLQSTSLSRETADTGQTIHAHSIGTSISCGQGRGYLVSHETQRGKNLSHAQADTCLQSALESGVNSDMDYAELYGNSTRTDTMREHTELQRDARGFAVVSNAQAGTGLRSTAPILQTSQTENLRVGSGDDTSLQNDWDAVTSVIQNFGSLISQQNEALNARTRQLNEAQDARMRQQNEALYARMRQQGESQNIMLRECLTGITNVVRENMDGIIEQFSNLNELIQSSCRQAGTREVTQVHENIARCDTVPPVESCRSSNTIASNGILHSELNAYQPGHSVLSVHTEPRYCHVDRRDSLPAIHVSESQTKARHAGQNDTSRHIPGNLGGPSDASVLQTDTRGAVPRLATIDAQNTVFNPSESNIRNTSTAANTSGPHEAFSRNRGVKLPVFSGNSSESWKVWFSRFTTVANLNNWDEPTRLSELVQKLQGTAADFVFDELPQEIVGNFQSLVHELCLRFQTVETNRTFRAQFGKRTQRIGESVEDYCAELKRIYDKAYPGRNPEMRQQLLLQQFLSGLRDKQAKFAVEYFKEPCTIEDAVHHVVTYMEAQQSALYSDRAIDRRSKSVRFKADAVTDEGDDDRNDEEENQKRGSLNASPNVTREQHTIRKVQTTPSYLDSNLLSQIIHCLTASVERETCHESKSNKTQVTPRSQDQTPRQGQMRPHHHGQCQSAGQNGFARMQCFHCANFGHFKRDCPFLSVQQQLNGNTEPPGTEPQEMQRTKLCGQGQSSSLDRGPNFESQLAVPPLNGQNSANLNAGGFNHEAMIRRVSSLINTRNSTKLSRHSDRSPVWSEVQSGKTTTHIESVSNNNLAASNQELNVSARRPSIEIETATMGSSELCETGTMGSSFPVSRTRTTNDLSVERPARHVGQQTGSINQKNGSTGKDVCPNIRSQHVAAERQLSDNENATGKTPCRDGLYVDGVINGVKMLFNIDTGATCTVISDRVYNSIPKEGRRPILTRCTEPTNATGQSLSHQGSAAFTIELGSGQKFTHEIKVARIEDDGILGHDLLCQGRAAILYNKNILRFMGASLPCLKISKSVPVDVKEP